MKYTKEVTEARKVYDSLVIEQREAKKELEAVKAEIRAKLDGKPSPHKFEELKKQETQLEARLGDLPVLIADARDATIAALLEYKKEMHEMATAAAESAIAAAVPEIKKVAEACVALDKAVARGCKALADLSGEPVEVSIDWLIEQSAKIYYNERLPDGRNLSFEDRKHKRLSGYLSEIAKSYAIKLGWEADNLKPKERMW